MDHGPQFTGKALPLWAQRSGVTLYHIQPGKPMQNAFIESFKGTFRDDCLNQHWFSSRRSPPAHRTLALPRLQPNPPSLLPRPYPSKYLCLELPQPSACQTPYPQPGGGLTYQGKLNTSRCCRSRSKSPPGGGEKSPARAISDARRGDPLFCPSGQTIAVLIVSKILRARSLLWGLCFTKADRTRVPRCQCNQCDQPDVPLAVGGPVEHATWRASWGYLP